ncbi:membrane-associated protein, putative [Bodo saltans]|uniref:Membrane-associated protein, putative n=1 Tax=Bodo saltans TaxID=75058 RepID=A0A0S4JQL3_BODSA|nr:membrane-associated protein, putative [Bodo saltans]|eukprot:CUG92639.1 membrane-associated protein, putative [Bodo saltans]
MASVRIAGTVAVFVSLLLFCASANQGGGCNVTDPFSDNKTINLVYLSKFGNVSLSNASSNNAAGSVDVSFCEAAPIVSRSGALCGSAFLAEVGAECTDSVLYDVVANPLTVLDQKTSQLTLSSSFGAQTATVIFVCQAGLDFASLTPPTYVGEHVTYTFTGEQVCAGYVPPPPEDEMLSKGAIVGIIIGIVGFVVIASALFQWRSRRISDGDGYEQI